MQVHEEQTMVKGGSAVLKHSGVVRGGVAAIAVMLFAALMMCFGSWTNLAYAEDTPADSAYFTVYHQKSDGTTEVAKEYTQEQFEALKSDSSDPVSGQYYKSGWQVWTATEYVTLEDLFTDAGLGDLYKDGSGASIAYDGKNGSAQTHDVSKLLSNSKFFPNAGTENETDASGSYSVPAVLALTGTSSAVTTTSKAAEEANLAAINAEGFTPTDAMPTMVFGTTDEAFAAKTSSGMQFWKGLTSITVVDPCFTLTNTDGTLIKGYSASELQALKSTSTDPVSGQYYKSGWQVWTATEYVTLEDLFADAGIADLYAAGSGVSITYEGKNGTQTHDVSKLLEDSKFFPNAGPGNETDTSGSYSVPAVLALTGTSSAVTTTSKAAEEANLAAINTEGFTPSKAMPTMIFGTTDEAFAAKTSSGMQFWNGLANIQVGPYFTLYFQGNDGTVKLVKRYTESEFNALKADSADLVSGMYFKSDVWNVATASEYVTLEDLFADAGLSDEYVDGASIAYDGKGGAQTHAVSKLLNDSWFFPNTEAANTNTEGAVKVPAVLALKYAVSAVATTAADAEAANVESASAEKAPVMVFGTTQEAYDDTTKSSGMQYWTGLTSLTLVEKPAPAVVTPAAQAVATSKASYTLVNGGSVSLGATAKTALTYKSSNAKVASVSSTGKVTAKGVGTAKITVTAKATDSYAAATKTVTVKVNPKGVKLSKAKGAKKSLKATWKKSTKANADGYQVRWSVSKKMAKAKTAKVKGYKASSKTIKKLKGKKTYYAQVRVYKKVGGKTYYSAWSTAKKAKTK